MLFSSIPHSPTLPLHKPNLEIKWSKVNSNPFTTLEICLWHCWEQQEGERMSSFWLCRLISRSGMCEVGAQASGGWSKLEKVPPGLPVKQCRHPVTYLLSVTQDTPEGIAVCTCLLGTFAHWRQCSVTAYVFLEYTDEQTASIVSVDASVCSWKSCSMETN